ncbi:MAG: putative PilT protein domain protein [Nitrososphaera sp.]|nr:putative PilT protein domain protein [Nitrososphaera sp.]
MRNKKFVLDTSIIIDGEITKMLEAGNIEEESDIIIPLAVLDELQSQASTNKEHGFVGLEEIKKMRELCTAKNISLRFVGQRPDLDDIRLAKHGRIDAIIKDVAMHESATLITADYVQALVAEAQGINAMHIRTPTKTTDLEFERYFDDTTMSVHLKEGTFPMAKRGKPGNFQLVKISQEKSTYHQLLNIIREVSEASRVTGTGSVEISRSGATLELEDYNPSNKLMERLSGKAEGIVIAGPPGSGKSTLASSVAQFYTKRGKIVKTFESPRDLQVPDEVTQYGPLEGSFEKAVDILLLVRPDYTIFDEVRRAQDFEVFADMRLAGVGMVGVVHASSPLDAIQRFMGRVELGMVPHILDTIIFVREGGIKKVYELTLTVKVPSGMTEADLARPLVEVRDFESGVIEYEIYTFGDENVVVPVSKLAKGGRIESGIHKLAQSKIMDIVRRFDPSAEVNVISDNKVQVRVSKEAAPRVIGKGGSTVSELEEMLGVKIDVEAKTPTLGKEIEFDISETSSAINILVHDDVIGHTVDVYAEDEYVLSSQVGKKARVKIDKRSESGKKILNAIIAGQEEIKVFISRR